MKTKLLLTLIIAITLIFSIAVALDLSPFLRGPAPYFPDWRWDYNFVNTFPKIWFPITISAIILCIFYFVEKKGKKWIEKKEKIILPSFFLLYYLFQFAVLYFNRAGINSLLNRIINPGVNGYFTSALYVKDVPSFLKEFNSIVLSLYMHAQGHPPFSVLFFWIINKLFSFTPFFNPLTSELIIKTDNIRSVWLTLPQSAKLGAIFVAVFIPMLVSLVSILVYLVAKKIYGINTAFRSLIVLIFVPNILLFIPINDVFIVIFPLASIILLINSIRNKQLILSLLSGLLFSVGLYFSISLLPIFIIIIFILVKETNFKIKKSTNYIIFYLLGLLFIPVFLYVVLGFDTIRMLKVLMSGLPEKRHYSTWVIYNLYDFFVFTGIPLTIGLIVLICNQIMRLYRRLWKNVDLFFTGFILMLLILNFSGSVRGETGRIWIPFVPFMIMPVVNFLTVNKQVRLSTNQFVLFVSIQLVVVLVLNEFWVALW